MIVSAFFPYSFKMFLHADMRLKKQYYVITLPEKTEGYVNSSTVTQDFGGKEWQKTVYMPTWTPNDSVF